MWAIRRFESMTVDKIGLVTFGLVFLFGFTWRASLQPHFYYMRWLDLVDMVNPGIEEKVFEKRVGRFGRILGCLSVASLLAIGGSVYWIVVEYERLKEPGVERLDAVGEVGSFEMEVKKLWAERRRQTEELLSRYLEKIDARILEMAKEGDFAALVEMNQERTYGLAMAKEVGNEIGAVDGVKLQPFAMLEVTTLGERLELRRSLTRAIGSIHKETRAAFVVALDGIEAQGREKGTTGASRRVGAEWGGGPPKGIFVLQSDLARTPLLPVK